MPTDIGANDNVLAVIYASRDKDVYRYVFLCLLKQEFTTIYLKIIFWVKNNNVQYLQIALKC